MDVKITKDNLILWKNFIMNLTSFLKNYEEFLDSYVLDFFCKDLWKKLPIKWSTYFESFLPNDLAVFIDKGPLPPSKEIPPLSLLSFRATCFLFTLPRKPYTSVQQFEVFLNNEHDDESPSVEKLLSKCSIKKNLVWKEPQEELTREGGQHYYLEHIFRKHLKPKKQHEVVRLSQLAAQVVQVTKLQVLVDVGSGQGHLARLLSYGFNIPCVCLDTEAAFIQGARKFDLQLEASLKLKNGYNGQFEKANGPRHATCHLHADLPPESINEMLKGAWPEIENPAGKDLSFGLIGLHSCGDLGPTLLRLFASNNNCSALISVGCCYMKLTVESEQSSCGLGESFGYPLSYFIQGLEYNKLSYIAREMSCHALEAYSVKLRNEADSLKVHCYRAILEEIIVKKLSSTMSHLGLRSVNKTHLLPFHEYATAAISRHDGLKFSREEFISEDIERKLAKWMLVVIFYSVRLMIAPAIETMILLDRVLYLYEKGHTCLLAPIFDPVLSPRNYVLVAKKT